MERFYQRFDKMNDDIMARHENTILLGDCRDRLHDLDDDSVASCITSPPYWGCRDYGVAGQIGIEENPLDYVTELANVFDIVQRKLERSGNLFIIIDDIWISNWTRRGDRAWVSSLTMKEGESSEDFREECNFQRNWSKDIRKKPGMAWFKAKQKMMLPERMAIEMQEHHGWFFREKLIWYKPNVGNYTNARDRFAHAFEYILHFTRSQDYYADMDSIREDSGKLRRDVISIPIERTRSDHPATFPAELARLLIGFSCPESSIVLDPFCGSGTTLVVASAMKRKYIGIELSEIYHEIAERRLKEKNKSLISSLDNFLH